MVTFCVAEQENSPEFLLASGLAKFKPISQQRFRIALRLWDWSDWCRQILRGVRSYAYGKPDWKLFVVSGSTETAGLYGMDQKWDGILTHVFKNSREVHRLWKGGKTKVVSFSSAVPSNLTGMPAVKVNDHRIATAIGGHLLAGGFRRLAYLHAPPAKSEMTLDGRAAAFKAFAVSSDVPFELFWPTHNGDLTMGSLVRGLKKLKKPIGIATWSMPFGRIVVQACIRAKIAVPDEVAVVAWDDDPLLAENMEPTVTGAVLPAERLGYEAAALLDKLLTAEPITSDQIVIEPSGVLHVRQSSDVSEIPNRDVHLALQYMREHAQSAYKIPNLLKALRASRSKLERDFRRVTGQTLNEAIIASHLERAKELLLETDWSIDRVAEHAGFGTKQHFHRTFARYLQETPGQYRERFGKT